MTCRAAGWGRFYLSTISDDYNRYIIAWKLCTNMKAGDVTDTLELALRASGCDQVHVVHKPRLPSPLPPFSCTSGAAVHLPKAAVRFKQRAP